MIRKTLKFLKWSLGLLLGVPALVYVIWICGNIWHDPLTPELENLLAYRPQQIAEKDNAYFDVIGLAAPDNMEPHRWGVSWFEQASANDRTMNAGGTAVLANMQRRTLPDVSAFPCSSKETGHMCLQEIAENPAAARNTVEQEALMLQRLDAFLDLNFQEPFREMSLQSEFPPFVPIATASKIAVIRIALEISQGNDDSALNRWGKETTFFLRQAQHSPSILGKMIAISILNRYQKLLAEYIALHPKEALARSSQIQAMLEHFNKDALSMQPAFDNEATVAARFMISPQMSLTSNGSEPNDVGILVSIVGKLASPLLDKQATANEFTRMHLECSRVAALDDGEHISGMTALSSLRDKPADLTTLLSFHNPIGKYILSASGNVNCVSYIYKSDDILANKQLLNWALKLKSFKVITPGLIEKELQANRTVLEHPSTGDLPVFDPQKNTLKYPVLRQLESTSYSPLEIRL